MKKYMYLWLVLMVAICMIVLSSCDSAKSTDKSGNFEDDIVESDSEKDSLSVYKKIAQNIECKDYETAIKLCDQITTISQDGKDIVMESLTKMLNSQMGSTLTSFCSTNALIDNRTIDAFKKYKQIVSKMQINDDDYTNVEKYIDLVISTEKYEKYEPLWCLIKEVETDYNNANTYFDRIKTSYADSSRKSHANQAKTAYQSCYTTSLKYNASDFGIDVTRRVFKYYVDELTDYINYGEFEGNSKLSAEYEKKMDEARREWGNLVNILDKFPTSVYYGEN